MLLTIVRAELTLLRPWTRENVDALHAPWTAPAVRGYLWDDVVITRDTASNRTWRQCRRPHQRQCQSPLWVPFHRQRSRDRVDMTCSLSTGERASRPRPVTRHSNTCGAQPRISKSMPGRTNRKSVQVMLRLGVTQESASESMIAYVLRRPM